MPDSTRAPIGRPPAQLVGGWELGLVILMAVLFAGGALVNPAFFGSGDAFLAILRDTARYAVVAVGMTFVIVNKDLDLVRRLDQRADRRRLLACCSRPASSIGGRLPATLFCLVLGLS